MDLEETPVTREEVEDIEDMVLENQKLLSENNELLKKILRGNTWAFWLRIAWIAIILGVPFIAYYYLIEPYFSSFQSLFSAYGIDFPSWGK